MVFLEQLAPGSFFADYQARLSRFSRLHLYLHGSEAICALRSHSVYRSFAGTSKYRINLNLTAQSIGTRNGVLPFTLNPYEQKLR